MGLAIMATPEIDGRIEQYQLTTDSVVESCLGVGTQGSVYVFRNLSQSTRFAVKFHDKERAYNREVAVYLRLRDLSIDTVCGHMIPQLVGHDDDQLTIEMTIVSPPYCLDFGGAYLDHPPDYSPEVWRDWKEMKSEAFDTNWHAVEAILAEFRSYRIYIADVNPGNIRFD